ncbi:molecular chaperone [Burkholderia sp. 22PA0106]|uniref:fimbrial biogenesis chaperone n=1 Tax=Burkholderia sp. 22PA0106 TaxID=3237371 RepID=UPI0039C088E6
MNPLALFRPAAPAIAAAALTLSPVAPAFAGVVLDGTRVVYPAHDRQVTVQIRNEGASPVLVQNWIDDGRRDAEPEAIDVPFVITPPIARVEAGNGQALRIAYTGATLPGDRESVFWLNVLEIPAKPADGTNRNHLQFAFRNRLKLFFRPADLPGSANAAAARLTWSLVPRHAVPGHALRIVNPTPFHVSLASIEVGGKGRRIENPPMIPPFDTVTVPVPGVDRAPAGATVHYESINDFGAITPADAALGQP